MGGSTGPARTCGAEAGRRARAACQAVSRKMEEETAGRGAALSCADSVQEMGAVVSRQPEDEPVPWRSLAEGAEAARR